MTESTANPFLPGGVSDLEFQNSRYAKADKICRILRHYRPNIKDLTGLDIGCYDGYMTQRYTKHLSRIIGTDVTQPALKKASTLQNSTKLNFVAYDGAKLPFSNHTFDILIVNHVFYYVLNQVSFLTEISRVMKVDGICYLTVINGNYANRIIKLPTWLQAITGKAVFGAPVNFGHPVNMTAYRSMFSAFIVEDITFYTLKNPGLYATDFVGWRRTLLSLVAKLPDSIVRKIASWSPTHIMILLPGSTPQRSAE